MKTKTRKEEDSMKTLSTSNDPRVKRTRQLLLQAFRELMEEKGFSAMTIQDITARATVNRGTFYAHFPDKYALLDVFIRDQFHQAVESKLPSPSRLGRTTLRLLIQTVSEHLSTLYHHCQPSDIIHPFLHPVLEQAAQEELTRLLLTWLKQGRVSKRVPVETMAVATSWAILGAVVQWCQGPKTLSAEQMADQALMVITEGLERLAPDAFQDSER